MFKQLLIFTISVLVFAAANPNLIKDINPEVIGNLMSTLKITGPSLSPLVQVDSECEPDDSIDQLDMLCIPEGEDCYIEVSSMTPPMNVTVAMCGPGLACRGFDIFTATLGTCVAPQVGDSCDPPSPLIPIFNDCNNVYSYFFNGIFSEYDANYELECVSSLCAVTVPVGKLCNEDFVCSGKACVSNVCTGYTLGEECSWSRPCEIGLYCNGSVCLTRHETGAACDLVNESCKFPDFCSHDTEICTALLMDQPSGQSCDENFQNCGEDLYCHLSVCEAPSLDTLGLSCSDDENICLGDTTCACNSDQTLECRQNRQFSECEEYLKDVIDCAVDNDCEYSEFFLGNCDFGKDCGDKYATYSCCIGQMQEYSTMFGYGDSDFLGDCLDFDAMKCTGFNAGSSFFASLSLLFLSAIFSIFFFF